MRRPRHAPTAAFSLIELMIAIMFIVIAFFGYVALHSRLLHSGQKLEAKETTRAATDFYSGILVSRAVNGGTAGPDGTPFVPVSEVPLLYRLDTTPTGNLAWLTENLAIPKSYHEGMDDTMQLSPVILGKPYSYSWSKR